MAGSQMILSTAPPRVMWASSKSAALSNCCATDAPARNNDTFATIPSKPTPWASRVPESCKAHPSWRSRCSATEHTPCSAIKPFNVATVSLPRHTTWATIAPDNSLTATGTWPSSNSAGAKKSGDCRGGSRTDFDIDASAASATAAAARAEAACSQMRWRQLLRSAMGPPPTTQELASSALPPRWAEARRSLPGPLSPPSLKAPSKKGGGAVGTPTCSVPAVGSTSEERRAQKDMSASTYLNNCAPAEAP
mmetsp:Transcript_58203/g.168623  ORF Transcript_58203/g.168623 Transcript_58203/m.168623 type:complete len:250 (+) Transcript_58203:368-1117(+)